MLKHRTH